MLKYPKTLQLMACLMLCCLPNIANGKTLPPKQECHAVADFAQARAAFEKSVATRDAAALLRMTSPAIQWSFGDDAGRTAFAKNWNLNDPKKAAASKIWAELDKIVKLGCAVEDDMIAYPHMFWRVEGIGNNSPAYLVTGTKVNLRAAPNVKTKSVGLLSWEVVDEIAPDPKAAVGWILVRTDTGLRGYIRQDYVRSDYDYRVIFMKTGGVWEMTAFIAGD